MPEHVITVDKYDAFGQNWRMSAGISGKLARAFISSTMEDLGDCRLSAQTASIQAQFFPVLSENFPASGNAPPLETCLAKVSECDVVVVVVARRYRWTPNSERSITWLECQRALDENKESDLP
jgi:hypothetical protein